MRDSIDRQTKLRLSFNPLHYRLVFYYYDYHHSEIEFRAWYDGFIDDTGFLNDFGIARYEVTYRCFMCLLNVNNLLRFMHSELTEARSYDC